MKALNTVEVQLGQCSESENLLLSAPVAVQSGTSGFLLGPGSAGAAVLQEALVQAQLWHKVVHALHFARGLRSA